MSIHRYKSKSSGFGTLTSYFFVHSYCLCVFNGEPNRTFCLTFATSPIAL
jgi:hypothetical protein